jgi:type VI secretion system protein ImpL
MGDGLKKALKVVLVLAGVALVVLLVVGLVLVLNWPWWVAMFLLVLVAAGVVSWFILRKLAARRREQAFVSEVIAQDEAYVKSLSGKEREELTELQRRWKEAVETLKKSHLREKGNPLYVLPWYMVIGESGSGKTTAIGSARLASSFAETTRVSGVSGTRNCDWWFFEQAILLDTAGRYAVHVDEGRDKDEWQKFLQLLVKHRKKEPIHGLLVTVAADKLLQASPETMEEDGKTLRRRIDELMRTLGATFPVYVLVTKCDLVQGMTKFCDRLPEKLLDQPMGVVNQAAGKDAAAFAESVFATVVERLRNLRLLLLNQPGQAAEPGVLLFPEEFANLKPGLMAFMKGAFLANPYQETPLLRGLYFSSGRQEGTPYSHFLNALGMIGEKEVQPGTNRGLFLHDVFAKVLPRDRNLFAPTKRALEWSALTRNLGIVAWALLVVALCGIMSFAFVKNLRAIREASREFTKPVVLQGEAAADLAALDRFAQAIRAMEARNRNWWIPRFGLNESVKVEEALKAKYCAQFRNGMLAPFDRTMGAAVAAVSPATPEDVVGQYVGHLARRINLLKARTAGEGIDALGKRPQPLYVSAAAGLGENSRRQFGNLYLCYLAWRTEAGEAGKETAQLQAWLKQLLASRGSGLRWITTWVDRHGEVPAVTLQTFWGGTADGGGAVSVPASFTRKGKELVDSFAKEVEAAADEAGRFADQRADLDRWYRGACFDAWRAFAAGFPQGVARLKGKAEWQQAAQKMATDQGAYFALIDRMAGELEPLVATEGAPGWAVQLYALQGARGKGTAGVVAKATGEGKKLLAKIEEKIGSDGGKGNDPGAGAKAFQDYQAALASLAPVASSSNQAFQVATQLLSEDPATGKSPFFAAQHAVARLRGSVVPDDLFGKLLSGPVEFFWAYTRNEAAVALQAMWEQNVLKEAQGGSPAAMQALVGPDGAVQKFVKGAAAPLVGWSVQRGYFPREAMGGGVPIEPSFFAFLKQTGENRGGGGAAKSSFAVQIKGLPTDTNPEAKVKPQSTRLELQCNSGTQSVVNYNFPVSKTFQYNPDQCGDVLFQIEVGTTVLTKQYPGNQGFAEFLAEFKGGKRTFFPNDFPAEKANLAKMGVKYVRVNYAFGGDAAAVGQMKALPGQLPKTIAKVWQ